MAHLITATNGAGTTAPIAIEGYAPSRQSRNVFTDLLDGSLGVAYSAPRPRSGQLRLFYATRALALASYVLHGQATSFSYANSDIADVGMLYALDGSLDWDQDTETGRWFVVVGYQELNP